MKRTNKIKMQNVKCKIKEVMAATRRFHYFDFLCLIFAFSLLVSAKAQAAAGQRRYVENPLVKVGEFAPDFELPKLTFRTDAAGKPIGVINEKDTVRLSSFRGKKPVCLIMSSYT